MASVPGAAMRIGDLARHAQCTVGTIRYYEKAGLLPRPARSAGNYRLYGPEHAERLRFIRCCRSLDMTLEEIRKLLRLREAPERDCAGVNALLEEHIAHVAARIAALRQLERQLRALRRLCAAVRSARQCAILRQLGSGTPRSAPGGRAAHVRSAHPHPARS